MESPPQNSYYLCCREFTNAYSFKRCCFFVFIFLFFTAATLGAITLIIFFVLKPREPVFSLQTIKLDAYKLDTNSNSMLFVSSVISLTLNAQNPNKVGIKYSRSRLHVLHEGLPIGEIKVPNFYQPAHSTNVSVRARVLFQCVNVSELIYGDSSEDDTMKGIVKMKLVGDIAAHVQVLHITLPKFKVALECDIGIDYKNSTFRNELLAVRDFEEHFASLISSDSETFSKNCSLAFYL
ncbi:uncharacterized protein LOC114267466 [Camellia sinensis]|uniref:uncharacterized protein LOC114267466 n=1 Tax=Camellia sinensis TaxID=4442 RepID=UPI001036B3C8|nr:uncharacterized protein LOC114267466 [Camellia sinensis]